MMAFRQTRPSCYLRISHKCSDRIKILDNIVIVMLSQAPISLLIRALSSCKPLLPSRQKCVMG